jgi:two-component system chemotaxis response regulator CheB
MIADAVRALRAHDPAVIGIGASAGAVEALHQLLPRLPAGFVVPIAIVVHVPADRSNALPALFQAGCPLRVCEAADKAMAEPGCIYFAPPDYHLLIERDGTLALSVDEPQHFSRPSIDVLFESVAHAFGRRALGILLSGASADGAEGLATMRRHGGLTWVQTPASARVATMPEAALALASHAIMHPMAMGQALADWGCARD